jgi:DNA-binding GntR family transcriptional regulator
VLEDPRPELELRLQLPAGGSVIDLVRVILINEEPTAVYRSWFDAARVSGLEHAHGLDGSLSAVLTEQYGLVPARGDNSLEVVRFTREDADLLNAPQDARRWS